MALHVLAYTLTRVLNIVGVKPLIAAMRAETPHLSRLHDLDPLTMPVRATRLPQHQNPKNMLETVARWSIRSTKGWPTPLQRVITQPRPKG